MANIGVYNITSSSFTCYVYDLDTSYLQDDRYIEWYIGDSNWNYVAGPLTSFLGAGVSSGGECLVDGLSSNTSYMVEALIYYNNGSDYVRLETSATTSAMTTTYNIYISVNNSSYGYALAFESSAAPGATVYIDATAYTGYRFAVWSSNPSVSFGDPFSASTYFIMPASNVTITANFIAGQARPNTFSWTNGTYNTSTGLVEKVSGTTFNLTAAEWNGLCQNINDVRVYKGLSVYSTLEEVNPGDTFYYYIYNRAVDAIQGISGYGTNLTMVDPNSITPVYAAYLNNLMYAINEVT